MIELIGQISIGFFWLTGFVFWWYIFKPIKGNDLINELGFDKSNRFNRFRLVWKALTRPWIFVVEWLFLTMDDHEQTVLINKMMERKK